jgi:hypothetical protein
MIAGTSLFPGGAMPSSPRRTSLVTSAAIAAGLLFTVASPHAQKKPRPDPDGPQPKVGVTIALAVGQERYDATGQGVCLEIPDGSILDLPAALYSVRQTSDKQRFNMTLYRLKKGGDMVTLNVTIGKNTHSVSTVKIGGDKGATLGSGTATLERSGKGGTLTLDAADAQGVKITGTVKCDAFNPPIETNGQ